MIVDRSEIMRAIARMCWDSPADCVRLAQGAAPEGLDLTALDTLRISSQGTVEVRIAERAPLIRLLMDASAADGGGVADLLAALAGAGEGGGADGLA